MGIKPQAACAARCTKQAADAACFIFCATQRRAHYYGGLIADFADIA
jgi:hypothetical protein